MRAALLAAIVTLVPASERFGRDITIVVDCSGSMVSGGDYYGDAVRTAVEVIQAAATDESRVRVVTFGDAVASSRWYEWPVPCDEVAQWLADRRPSPGIVTHLGPALELALRDGDAVVISDGVIYDQPAVFAALEKHPKRVLATIHVGDRAGRGLLRTLGERGKGGVYQLAGER